MGRINQLTPTTTLSANSVIAMDAESGGATKKVTIQTLAAGLRSFGNYATQAQLAAKQDVLTFDDSPEEDSENPVTSGGIYNAIGSAMSNVYTKTETDNAIAQSTAKSTYASSDVFDAQSGGTIKTNYSFAAKVANVCYMQLNVIATSGGSIVTVAALKSGFIPYNKSVYTMAIDEDDNSTREVFINVNSGQISIYKAVSGHTYNISATYIV